MAKKIKPKIAPKPDKTKGKGKKKPKETVFELLPEEPKKKPAKKQVSKVKKQAKPEKPKKKELPKPPARKKKILPDPDKESTSPKKKSKKRKKRVSKKKLLLRAERKERRKERQQLKNLGFNGENYIIFKRELSQYCKEKGCLDKEKGWYFRLAGKIWNDLKHKKLDVYDIVESDSFYYIIESYLHPSDDVTELDRYIKAKYLQFQWWLLDDAISTISNQVFFSWDNNGVQYRDEDYSPENDFVVNIDSLNENTYKVYRRLDLDINKGERFFGSDVVLTYKGMSPKDSTGKRRIIYLISNYSFENKDTDVTDQQYLEKGYKAPKRGKLALQERGKWGEPEVKKPKEPEKPAEPEKPKEPEKPTAAPAESDAVKIERIKSEERVKLFTKELDDLKDMFKEKLISFQEYSAEKDKIYKRYNQ